MAHPFSILRKGGVSRRARPLSFTPPQIRHPERSRRTPRVTINPNPQPISTTTPATPSPHPKPFQPQISNPQPKPVKIPYPKIPNNHAVSPTIRTSGIRFLKPSPHPLCAKRKTPPQSPPHVPVFQHLDIPHPRFLNRVPLSTQAPNNTWPAYPLFHPQRLLPLLKSLLSPCFLEASLAPATPSSLGTRLTQSAPEIHSPTKPLPRPRINSSQPTSLLLPPTPSNHRPGPASRTT